MSNDLIPADEKVIKNVVSDLTLLLNKQKEEVKEIRQKEFEDWNDSLPEDLKIYPLQEKYARLLVELILSDPTQKKYNYATGMQSGKSGFISAAVKMLAIEKLGYKMIYVCSLSDKQYWQQCLKQFCFSNLSARSEDLLTQFEESESLIVAKPSELKKSFTARKNEKYIIFWDECHYGDAKRQGIDQNLLKRLRGEGHIIVGVSATSFSMQQRDWRDSEFSDNAIILAPTLDELSDAGYKGISSMIANDQLRNPEQYLKLKDGLNPYIRDAVKLAVEDYRVSKGQRNILFFRLPSSSKNTMNVLKDLKALVKEEFGNIKVRFKDVTKLGFFGYEIPHKDRVIVYYTKNGLRAGKRMETDTGNTSLIPHVSLVWETSTSHVAAGNQGLPGRFCSYKDNSNIRIYCNDKLLRFYGEYEEANYDLSKLESGIFKKYSIRDLDGRTRATVSFREEWSVKELKWIDEETFKTKWLPKIEQKKTYWERKPHGKEQKPGYITSKDPRYQTMWQKLGASQYHFKTFEMWVNRFEENNVDGIASYSTGFEQFSRKGTDKFGVKYVRLEDVDYGFMVFDGVHQDCKKSEWDKLKKRGYALLFTKGDIMIKLNPEVETKGIHQKGYNAI